MLVNDPTIAQAEIENWLIQSLPAEISASQVKFANASCDQSGSAWLRLTINPTTTYFTTGTGCRERTEGIVTIDIFYEAGRGSRAATAMAFHLKQAFCDKNTQNVDFYEVNIAPQGEDGDRYHVQLNINYAHEGRTGA